VKLRVLIVDDEPLARERIRALLRDAPETEVVGECGDGRRAVAAIRRRKPDLVFLDVQMPELDGFEVLRALGPAEMPAVIFVTAYDRYALRAFEVHALDYLLKPFDRERFQRALARARSQLERDRHGAVEKRLLALLEDLQPGRKRLERLVVKEGGRIFFLRADEIDWVEAQGNYARLHVGRETHLVRETMARLEAGLDPKHFARIHRSAIVNLERVREMRPDFHGDYAVVLRDGTRLTLSRNFREKFREFFGDAR